jgi:hypothetical protein
MVYVPSIPDGRTRAGKLIKNIKYLIKKDLDAAAVRILQDDISNLNVIAQLCFESALKNPDQAVSDKGKLHPALQNYLKLQGAVRTGLTALKRFENKSSGGIADFFEEAEE